MKQLPDFKTFQERDAWFTANADYYSVVKKEGVGHYARDDAKTLDEAKALATTRQAIGGGNYLIYAIVNEQSALVQAMPFKASLKKVEGKTDLL